MSWLEENSRQFVSSETAFFVVERQRDGVALGSMGLIRINWPELRAEVGYWILAQYRRQGYTRRALELLCGWSFLDLGIQRLELFTNLDNSASQHIARRCRFSWEGTLRSFAFGRNGRETLHIFSRLPQD
jgi:RimJ/RimL family protein N-acetyltransferase